MLNSFFLCLVLHFLFNSLLRNVVSLGLVADFRNIFNLMVNDLILSDVLINWYPDSFFKSVVFCNYLLIRHIFESAFTFHYLTVLGSDLSSLE